MEEEGEVTDKSKIKRYGVWAIFLIALGSVASYTLPEESRVHFFQLLSDIIVNLVAI
jgi:hypothetical protein